MEKPSQNYQMIINERERNFRNNEQKRPLQKVTLYDKYCCD